MVNIQIRFLNSLKEMAAVEALQRSIWDDPTTVVYQHMLISFARNGGAIIGAFDGDTLVGFLLSYLGTEHLDSDRPAMANLKLVSQRMAVLPKYRNIGIAYELKLAQRKFAIKQGIRLITWTYDPLMSRNAHLNIRKLGAIVSEYARDYYGTDPSPLTSLGSSDRVVVEWWITNNRVEQRMSGKRNALTLDQYTSANAPLVNPSSIGARGYLYPGKEIVKPQGNILLVEIPDNYEEIKADAPDLAKEWRQHTRAILEELIGTGYIITDFVRGPHEGRIGSFYALSHGEAILSRFSSN